MNRTRLANRRSAELFSFTHNGTKWIACISRSPDGRIAEIFLDAGKNTPLAAMAQESAIVVSLALQSGCDIDTLRHALDGRDVGPIARALDVAEGAQ
jgi:hypothetical protein